MEVTTAGRFRVYRSPRDGDELLLLELPDERVDWTDPAVETDADDAYSPTYVPRTGYDGDLEARVSALEPGNEIEATLRWDDGDPRFEELSVRDRTRFRFVGAATGSATASSPWTRFWTASTTRPTRRTRPARCSSCAPSTRSSSSSPSRSTAKGCSRGRCATPTADAAASRAATPTRRGPLGHSSPSPSLDAREPHSEHR